MILDSADRASKRSSSPNRCLDFERYLDSVEGLWIGKFIGGTLGAPVEGLKEVHSFTDDVVPGVIAENDDTDLQLLWLHALEVHGVELGAEELVAEWREHVRAPWNEYGIAAANWACGVFPPASGSVNNWFWKDGMGCPIRSEIWGAICPGDPALAARFAAADASLDHAGDSVEAEKFLSAVEAALFFEKDLSNLIDEGLRHVLTEGRFASMVRDVRVWAAEVPWTKARAMVLAKYGHPEATHVLQNVGFTLIGLIAGRGNFGRTLAITLNCGYDADCTAATAGAILGGILGLEKIPARYRDAVPAEYKVSSWMLGFPQTGRISDLSAACCHIGRKVALAHATGVEISTPTVPRPDNLAVKHVTAEFVVPPSQRFPMWLITGPFWRAWTERRQSDAATGEHGIPHLPSVHYFSHDQSGFDCDFISPGDLDFKSPTLTSASLVRQADSDVLPLEGLSRGDRPVCFYAAAEFNAPQAAPVWLMAGSTGPLEVWLNGEGVIRSETYQPLTPTTFPAKVQVRQGRNQIVLKLASTSQPLGAYVAFKRFAGLHWHQCFYETSFNWQPAPASLTVE